MDDGAKTFSCSLDAWGKMKAAQYRRVGIVLPVLLVFGGIGILRSGPAAAKWAGVVALVAAGLSLVLGLVVPMVFLRPRNYRVGSKEVVVERAGPDARIPLAEIKTVKAMSYDEVFGDAVGGGSVLGLFGVTGSWRGGELGRFAAYVTRQDTIVVIIESNGRATVLSPDDREGFIAAVGAGVSGRTG